MNGVEARYQERGKGLVWMLKVGARDLGIENEVRNDTRERAAVGVSSIGAGMEGERSVIVLGRTLISTRRV